MPLKPAAARTVELLRANTRGMASTIAVVMLMSAVVAVRHGEPQASRPDEVAAGDSVAYPSTHSIPRSPFPPAGGGPAPGSPGADVPRVGVLPRGLDRGGNGRDVALPGFDFARKEIHVVYYWKGDRTTTSPYLNGTGRKGDVDEGEAFRRLVQYVNKHAGGGRTFMGIPFDLHGWKIRLDEDSVIEAGTKAENWAFTAESIARRARRPVAAISSHGSLSAYTCERIAQAGIHNFATYDLFGSLQQRTNGYCVPSGLAFERQVDLTVSYLQWHQAATRYRFGASSQERVYGVLYARYPSLEKIMPSVERRLRRAGLNIPAGAVLNISEDLTTSQTETSNRVSRFRELGVNTIIMPDAGAPLNFTPAAQANQYYPDYYVWPCSGQDSSGMVRLFNAAQWSRASGLTCYDDTFDADLTNDDRARRTEWYRMYHEVAPGDEPPAPTALVFNAMAPLIAGLTEVTGTNTFTVEAFRRGFRSIEPFRYHGYDGRTTAPDNILVTFGAADGSVWGDVAKVVWSPSATKSGSATPGSYVYTESRRYQPGDRF